MVKLKIVFSFNRCLDGSAFSIRVFSNLRSCLFVCPMIEHLVKRSCNEDNNFGRWHNEANTFGNHKFKYGNVKFIKAEINKERRWLIFCESNSFNGLFF